jgi:hypothetical protein
MFGRGRFSDVISRQLDLFANDNATDLRGIAELHETWNAAARDDAEEAFGDYADAVDWATEILADMRDRFASTLSDSDAERFEREFNRAAARRFPMLSRELDA